MGTRHNLHILRRIENRLWLLSLGVIFRVNLELSYVNFVSPIFEYAGFLLSDNPGKYIESWVLFVGMLLTMPAKAKMPSDSLICAAFFSFMAPLLVFYGFAEGSRWVVYYVLIQYATMNLVRLGRPIDIGRKFAVSF